jgi:hypothetical protein
METHREVVEPTPTVATDRTQATTYDPYSGRRAMSIKLTRAIYLIGVGARSAAPVDHRR